MTPPTLNDLKAARAALEAAGARQDAYDGNNPNKHHTAVRLAREEVDRLTRALKALGALPKTDHERLEARLDAAFPSARHNDEVEFEGVRYSRWARPATRSRSGRAMTWDTGWTRIEPVAVDKPSAQQG
ncbi:MAG: hypothetical protein EON87_01150 [Brevundimonas sp.]|nr:MAG: hypothetical protein EON87_01150 [Brevundimonas sp.]